MMQAAEEPISPPPLLVKLPSSRSRPRAKAQSAKAETEEEKKSDHEIEDSAKEQQQSQPRPQQKQPQSQPQQKQQQQQQPEPPNLPTSPTAAQNARDYLQHLHMQGDEKKAGTAWWERVVVQRSSYVVEDLVEQYTQSSKFLQRAPLPAAWLDRMELTTGALLGAGTYSNVCRVDSLQLFPDFLDDHPVQRELRGQFRDRVLKRNQQQQHPNNLSHNSSSNSINNPHYYGPTQIQGTGYAMKHLKPELLQNSKLFEAAAADLIMEAKYLMNLDHPNILKLRGMALGGTSTFAATGLFDSYFLVVDELQETLIQRIQLWKVQGSTDQYRPAMVLHKLKLALQIASALAYLHERRLVFRDLKPHNIGLKDNSTIQLFDFGFCRELPAPDNSTVSRKHTKMGGGRPKSGVPGVGNHNHHLTQTEDDEEEEDLMYYMSGKGTLMYMASEILGTRCYNQKADTYSWSMVVYELLTLQKPFAIGSIEQHKKTVCERGERPPLQHLSWLPEKVKELLQYAWIADVHARWSMQEVKHSLESVICELERNKFHFARGSSFGFSADKTKSVFCSADDIILDVTNSVQTRYDHVMQKIFCFGPHSCQNTSDDGIKAKSKAGQVDEEYEEMGKEVTLPEFLATASLSTINTASSRLNHSHSHVALASRCTSASTSRGHSESDDVFDDQVGGAFLSRLHHHDEEDKAEAEQVASAALADMSLSDAMWGGSSALLPKPKEQYLMASMAMSSARLEANASRRSINMTSSRRGSGPKRRASMNSDSRSSYNNEEETRGFSASITLDSGFGSVRLNNHRKSNNNVPRRRASIQFGSSVRVQQQYGMDDSEESNALAASIHLDSGFDRASQFQRRNSGRLGPSTSNLGTILSPSHHQQQEQEDQQEATDYAAEQSELMCIDELTKQGTAEEGVNKEEDQTADHDEVLEDVPLLATPHATGPELSNSSRYNTTQGDAATRTLSKEEQCQQQEQDKDNIPKAAAAAAEASIDTSTSSSATGSGSRRNGPNPQDDQGSRSNTQYIFKTASV